MRASINPFDPEWVPAAVVKRRQEPEYYEALRERCPIKDILGIIRKCVEWIPQAPDPKILLKPTRELKVHHWVDPENGQLMQCPACPRPGHQHCDIHMRSKGGYHSTLDDEERDYHLEMAGMWAEGYTCGHPELSHRYPVYGRPAVYSNWEPGKPCFFCR